MTLDDIERIPGDILTANDVAPYLGCNPHQLRIQARDDPAKLGFPVIVHGTRVIIPKAGFVFFARFGHPVPGGEEYEKIPGATAMKTEDRPSKTSSF